jgi:phage baseplate assembly protein V
VSGAATDHRVRNMVTRVTVAGVDPAPQMQEVQVDGLADETQDGAEHFEPYGFTSHPFGDAEGIGLAVGGLRSHMLVINVADRRYRMTGLEEGEVAIHDDQGQSILLGRDGIVIRSDKGLTIDATGADIDVTCDNFTVTASAKITLDSDDIEVGNSATLPAARKTDPVSGAAISNGSTKVKIA